MTLDPHAGRLLRMLAATGRSAGGGTLQDRRRSLDSLAKVAAGSPTPMNEVEALSIAGPGGALPLRCYRPFGATRGTLLFLHGGGWVAGGLDTHDGVCRRLAQASGAAVLAVDYRLAPEHQFPAAFNDAIAAIRWASVRSEMFVVAGDSAGANLAAAACLALGEAVSPTALLLLCPILDLARESPSRRAFSEGYFLSAEAMTQDLEDYVPQGADLFDPRLSPLHARDLSALPPTHLHVAEFDPFRDEGLAFGERLKTAGVDVHMTQHAGMIHYFYALSGAVPYADQALGRIGADIKAAFGAHSRT
jgi:acetyl esterase/lipase